VFKGPGTLSHNLFQCSNDAAEVTLWDSLGKTLFPFQFRSNTNDSRWLNPLSTDRAPTLTTYLLLSYQMEFATLHACAISDTNWIPDKHHAWAFTSVTPSMLLHLQLPTAVHKRVLPSRRLQCCIAVGNWRWVTLRRVTLVKAHACVIWDPICITDQHSMQSCNSIDKLHVRGRY